MKIYDSLFFIKKKNSSTLFVVASDYSFHSMQAPLGTLQKKYTASHTAEYISIQTLLYSENPLPWALIK